MTEQTAAAPPAFVHKGTALPDAQVPGHVRLIPDVAFGEDPRQSYDVYVPKDAAGPVPVVVFIHGGAYVRRDKRAVRIMHVLDHGYALVSIGYRLATQALFPAQIQDINAGLSHLVRHAAGYGIDPDRLVLSGASAGGHFANLAALARDVPEFHSDPAVRIRGVVSIYGVSDLISMSAPIPGGLDHDGPEAPGQALLGVRVRDRPDLGRWASPVSYVSDSAPPFLVLHGDDDRVVPFSQSVQLDGHLRLAGARSELVRLAGAGHGDMAFQTGDAAARIRAFIAGCLAPCPEPAGS